MIISKEKYPQFQAEESRDEDVQATAAQVTMLDPVSRALYEDPVKVSCGHTYSRETAEDLCRRRARCAVAGETWLLTHDPTGCNVALSMESIVDDVEAAVIVKRMKLRQRKN